VPVRHWRWSSLAIWSACLAIAAGISLAVYRPLYAANLTWSDEQYYLSIADAPQRSYEHWGQVLGADYKIARFFHVVPLAVITDAIGPVAARAVWGAILLLVTLGAVAAACALAFGRSGALRALLVVVLCPFAVFFMTAAYTGPILATASVFVALAIGFIRSLIRGVSTASRWSWGLAWGASGTAFLISYPPTVMYYTLGLLPLLLLGVRAVRRDKRYLDLVSPIAGALAMYVVIGVYYWHFVGDFWFILRPLKFGLENRDNQAWAVATPFSDFMGGRPWIVAILGLALLCLLVVIITVVQSMRGGSDRPPVRHDGPWKGQSVALQITVLGVVVPAIFLIQQFHTGASLVNGYSAVQVMPALFVGLGGALELCRGRDQRLLNSSVIVLLPLGAASAFFLWSSTQPIDAPVIWTAIPSVLEDGTFGTIAFSCLLVWGGAVLVSSSLRGRTLPFDFIALKQVGAVGLIALFLVPFWFETPNFVHFDQGASGKALYRAVSDGAGWFRDSPDTAGVYSLNADDTPGSATISLASTLGDYVGEGIGYRLGSLDAPCGYVFDMFRSQDRADFVFVSRGELTDADLQALDSQCLANRPLRLEKVGSHALDLGPEQAILTMMRLGKPGHG